MYLESPSDSWSVTNLELSSCFTNFFSKSGCRNTTDTWIWNMSTRGHMMVSWHGNSFRITGWRYKTDTWWCHDMETLSVLLAGDTKQIHDGVMTWKLFPYYWLEIQNRYMMVSWHGNSFRITGWRYKTNTWWCHDMETLSVLLAGDTKQIHDDVMTWKLFPYYWLEIQNKYMMVSWHGNSFRITGWRYKTNTVETLYNTVNFCWSTHKRHSIARPKGRGMGCLLWVQRATYCVLLSKLSSIKYLL